MNKNNTIILLPAATAASRRAASAFTPATAGTRANDPARNRPYRWLPLMILACLAVRLPAYQFGDFTFTSDGTSITITGYPSNATGTVEIPATIAGMPVTTIGDNAFSYCCGLTSITIPASATGIGDAAFSYCSGLTSVAIPASVTSIGDSAFDQCSGLTSVAIPASVTSIGSHAFQGCSGLTSLTIPATVTNIGLVAFSDCSGLTSIAVATANPNYSAADGVLFNKSGATLIQCPGGKAGSYTIPASVTSIGTYAFGSCGGLTSVTIPAGVTSIGDSAFEQCSGLASIAVDATNPNYLSADGVLFNKSGTTLIQFPGGKAGDYQIPTGVTNIGEGAFSGCSGLTSVTISEGVTSIGVNMFSGCSGLTSVTIPSSVTSIGTYAFSGCSGLTSIVVAAANPSYSAADGVLFNTNRTTLILCPEGKAGSYTIPASVTSIGTYAFDSCGGLTSVTIPAGVTSIGGGAFIHCNGLTSVTIPASVTSIGDSAFSACAGLTSIAVDEANPNYSAVDGVLFNKSRTSLIRCPDGKTGSYQIPAGVTSIGTSAFYGCSGLTGVTIPASVTGIGSPPFEQCSGLASIAVDAAHPNYSAADGVLFNKSGTWLIRCPEGKAGSYQIPIAVTNIGMYAFSGCSELTSLTIPASVTSIGSGAFEDCSGLTSVTIPASVTSIGSWAFYGCSKLTAAVFMGNAPWSLQGLDAATVYYFTGRTGFTSPTWRGCPAVNMGDPSPVPPWLLANGLPHNADLRGDPNGDGVNLLVAYALDLDPNQNLAGSMPRPVVAGNQMSLTFYAGSAGVSYAVESSADLRNWSTTEVILLPPDANGFRTATLDMTAPSCFMRLVVSLHAIEEPGFIEGFVRIPAGEFLMGDQSSPLVGDTNELPVHPVRVSAFYMEKYEVSEGEWAAVADWGFANGYTDLPTGGTKAATFGVDFSSCYPVNAIDWYDAVKWCNARSEKDGLTPCYTVAGATYKTGSSDPVCNWSASGYRLPTEAEWEKAARGGVAGQNFPWGNTITHSQANYRSSSSYAYDVSPTRGYHPAYYRGPGPQWMPSSSPVGSFASNGYGLYDMAGNMAEWCWDMYEPYVAGSQTDPRGATSGSLRVLRGGSSGSYANQCRIAFRIGYSPTIAGGLFGIRVARTAVGLIALPAALTVTEGGTSTFTVQLAFQPPADVTVTTARTTGDPDLDVSGGATLIFTPANWNEPQTITIAAAADADASNGQAAFELCANGLTYQTVTVTEADIDIPVLTVGVAALAVWEGAGPAATTVTITRNLELTHALTVALASSDPTAATVPATAIIPAGETSVTVNLDAVDDAVADGPATVAITASAAGFVSGTATVRVTDDEIRFAWWAGASGLTGADALPGATPHGDGVANLLKYAFNLNGGGPDVRRLVPGTGTSGLPVLTRDDSGSAALFRFEFLRRKFGGLSYTPVQSATLAAGSWLPMTGTVTVTDINDTWERVVIEEAYEVRVPARFFRVEVTLPDGVPEGFVLIPAGSFEMGNALSASGDGFYIELPVHTVQVSAFYMAKYEVTKELWDSVRAWGLANGYTDLPAGSTWEGTDLSIGPNHPVCRVTWHDVVKWCNARSEKEALMPCYTVSGALYKTGLSDAVACNWRVDGYRLPTEAEWEKAARGGLSGKRFPWGDTISHTQANYWSNTDNSYDVSPTRGPHPTYADGGDPCTSPVGSFAANDYGLYDMVGNVGEWCWDWAAFSVYPSTPQTDPRGELSGSNRAYRGGSHFAFADSCRVACRGDIPPYYYNGYLGFRLARSSGP